MIHITMRAMQLIDKNINNGEAIAPMMCKACDKTSVRIDDAIASGQVLIAGLNLTAKVTCPNCLVLIDDAFQRTI
jgi:hypothetical protein